MKFERRTQKLYYSDFFLTQTKAKVTKVGPDYIELDATVAYPEGGGQEADHGTITLDDGRVLRFTWAKKVYANLAGLAEFPDVQVDGVIWHTIHPDDAAMLAGVLPGTDVTVAIDPLRRAQLSLSHTASHLVYLGIARFRPDALKGIYGCHIKTDGARFDFAVEERFSNEEVAKIEEEANGFVARDSKITVSAHLAVPDARLWHTEGQTIPCGGTHLDHAAPVGRVQVRRKGLGAGKERISCTFPEADFALERYHP